MLLRDRANDEERRRAGLDDRGNAARSGDQRRPDPRRAQRSAAGRRSRACRDPAQATAGRAVTQGAARCGSAGAHGDAGEHDRRRGPGNAYRARSVVCSGSAETGPTLRTAPDARPSFLAVHLGRLRLAEKSGFGLRGQVLGRWLVRHVRIAARGTFERAPQVHPSPTERVKRSLPAPRWLLTLVLIAAAVGYLVGHSGSAPPTRAGHARVGKTANVLIEYPPSWRTVADGPAIPGLDLAQARRLAPGGASNAGLLVGTLPAGEPGPLPAALLEQVRRQPKTTIVNLAELQAYRYTQLSVRKLASALTVFVVPDPAGHPTVLACYAPATGSGHMRECEQIAASASLPGQPQTYQLTPEAGYARAISDAIGTLDGLRASLARELRPQVSAATAKRLARRLASGYAAAGASLARLEPTPVAQRSQQALVSAIDQAGSGYSALAAAAAETNAAAYTVAQARIAAAEAAVDRALENFVLLGYAPR